MRLGEFRELLGRRETLDRRPQHGVRIDVTIGDAMVRDGDAVENAVQAIERVL